MKVLIVASEFPYPPIHGGRVDTWNRILALKKSGAEVFLISWSGAKKGDHPTDTQLNQVKEVVVGLINLPIPRNFSRILNMVRYPSMVAARILTGQQFSDIFQQVKKFAPDFLLIDHIYAGHTGLRLGKELNVPVSIRLHNVEYAYMQGQYDLEKNFRNKLSLLLAKRNLEWFENRVITKVDAFFDISIADMNYRKTLGYTHGYWLPPFLMPDNKLPDTANESDREYDIGFCGNLYTPNNVKGLIWFIDDILPLVKKEFKDIRIIISGSQPVSEIVDLCKIHEQNITLVANPVNMNDYYRKIKVLINPVRFGSGINIKSIDMLFRQNQVVSTSVGVKGLQKEFEEVFYVADKKDEFAFYVIDLLKDKISKDIHERDALKKTFDGSTIESFYPLMMIKRTSHK